MEFKNGCQYFGAVEKGMFEGQGQLTFTSGVQIYGLFHMNDIREGKIIFPNSSVFEGGIKNFRPEGEGTLQTTEYIYKGNF